MIGQERTVLPLLAERRFHLTAFTADAHVHRRVRRRQGGHELLRRHPLGPLRPQTGPRRRLADRRPGAAAVHLGADVGLDHLRQRLARREPGLTWSTTVIMKIDLVGPERRGLAMGLNEAAGYGAVALTALATGFIAANAGLRPEPFFLGARLRRARARPVGRCSCARPSDYARHEARRPPPTPDDDTRLAPARCSCSPASGRRRCRRAAKPDSSTTSTTGSPGGCSRIFFADAGLSVGRIGMLAALYPAVWGLGQLVTGGAVGSHRPQAAHRRRHVRPSRRDRLRSPQPPGSGRGYSAPCSSASAPRWCIRRCSPRSATSPTRSGALDRVGVYRLWRDAGFAVGAILAGILADTSRIDAAIWAVAALTAASGIVVVVRMYETNPERNQPNDRAQPERTTVSFGLGFELRAPSGSV